MRARSAVAALLSVTSLLLLALAPPAGAGGKPDRETVTFSETFADEELSEACGVEVTTTVDGRLTFLTFPDGSVGLDRITSVHVMFRARAGDNTVVFHDVGIDLVRVRPDGTAILMIVGQVPFGFTGVLKIDLATGEAILEPVHLVTPERACRLLTN